MLNKLSPITRETKHRLPAPFTTVGGAKKAQKEALRKDFDLFERLMNDALYRRSQERLMGLRRDPMSVWEENIDTSSLSPPSSSQVTYRDLPEWDALTEGMKLLLAYDLGREFDVAYSFTVHIDHDVAARLEGSSNWFTMLKQRIDRGLLANGIRAMPIFYVLETRTRGGSKSRPHLHGFALIEKPLDATKLKLALERALNPSRKRVGKRRAIDLLRSYDHPNRGEFLGRAAWIWYASKAALIGDRKFPGRRVHLSRSLTDLARDVWQLRREAIY